MAALVTAAASPGVRSLYCQVTKVVADTGAVKGDGEQAPLTVTVNELSEVSEYAAFWTLNSRLVVASAAPYTEPFGEVVIV